MLTKLATAKIPFWIIIFIYALTFWVGVLLFAYMEHGPVYNITLPLSESESIEVDYGPLPLFQDREYFTSVKEQFIANDRDFIKLNLETMNLTAYQTGEEVLNFPIAATGQSGTWTETPAGLYAIELKAGNHLSSFYNVYMPYSLQFYGNYFIHGWPYHPGGRPVVSENSAGCVRLETDHAQELYELARVGMPVLVFEQGYERDDFLYFDTLEDISGTHFIGLDLRSDFVFFEENLTEPVQIGELSKLLIALTASERLPLGTTMAVNPSAAREETLQSRFSGGERATLFTLLALLLNETSTEAATAIVQRLGSEHLTDLIDRQLQSLGMEETEIEKLTGGAGNVSSAHDMVALAKYLYFNRSSLLKLSRGNFDVVYLNLPFSDVRPFHNLQTDPNFVGGFVTAEGEGSVGSALAIYEIEVRGEIRPIGLFVANSLSPIQDLQEMLAAVKLLP